MHILAIVLLALGIFSLIVEMLIPGFGIFGVFGIIFIIASWGITLFVFKFGLLIVFFEIIFVSVFMFLLIKELKRRQIYCKLILCDILPNSKKDIGNLEDFIGREGTSKTALRPFGIAEFNGINIEVFSDNGYISNNIKIKVIRVSENKMYVKALNSNN